MIDDFPYWTNPEMDQFDTIIETCLKSEDHYQIRISNEVVRAAGGGQAGDKGTIRFGDKFAKFSDTSRIDSNLVLISDSPIDPGMTATIHIDMDWRRAMMRNHTGEHLFVAAIKRKYPQIELGYIWIDGDRGTIELEGKELGIEDLIEAELDVQGMIEKAAPVETKFVKASEISPEIRAREGLIDRHEMMRIVRIQGHDSSACSGTHVANTHDIGIFKVIDFKVKEDVTRVAFIAGNKAKKVMEATFNEVLRRKHNYPFEMEQVGDVLDKAKSAAGERKILVEAIVKLLTKGITSEDIEGVTLYHESIPGLDSKNIKKILKKFKPSGPAVVLLFVPGEKSTFTLSTNEMPLDAKDYVAPVVEKMGGRGGGSREVYNGGFSKTKNPEETYSEIVEYLRIRLRE